jgi:hypothetical protein
MKCQTNCVLFLERREVFNGNEEAFLRYWLFGKEKCKRVAFWISSRALFLHQNSPGSGISRAKKQHFRFPSLPFSVF